MYCILLDEEILCLVLIQQKHLLLLLFLPSFAIGLDYTFSLNYPFLLRNDYMGITSVTRDIGNEVLMFLQNN